MIINQQASGGGGSGLPVGDKFRADTRVFVGGLTTNTTILNVASGGGILHGILLYHYQGTSRLNVKITVDGATERNLGNYFGKVDTVNEFSFFLPLPIDFASSLIVKLDNAGSNGVEAQAFYHVK